MKLKERRNLVSCLSSSGRSTQPQPLLDVGAILDTDMFSRLPLLCGRVADGHTIVKDPQNVNVFKRACPGIEPPLPLCKEHIVGVTFIFKPHGRNKKYKQKFKDLLDQKHESRYNGLIGSQTSRFEMTTQCR